MNKLLVFSASWCRPCNALKPTLLELDQDRLVYYDIDTHLEERASHDIRGVPTLILVSSEGEELERLVGSQPLSKLQALLNRE
jgi:thioredoxin-like negative regulator of GroEL